MGVGESHGDLPAGGGGDQGCPTECYAAVGGGGGGGAAMEIYQQGGDQGCTTECCSRGRCGVGEGGGAAMEIYL